VKANDPVNQGDEDVPADLAGSFYEVPSVRQLERSSMLSSSIRAFKQWEKLKESGIAARTQ
jgi:hypothetical protein